MNQSLTKAYDANTNPSMPPPLWLDVYEPEEVSKTVFGSFKEIVALEEEINEMNCLIMGQVFEGCLPARVAFSLDVNHVNAVFGLLDRHTSASVETRVASTYALGCLLGQNSLMDEQLQKDYLLFEHNVVSRLIDLCSYDGSVTVRRELVFALARFLEDEVGVWVCSKGTSCLVYDGIEHIMG